MSRKCNTCGAYEYDVLLLESNFNGLICVNCNFKNMIEFLKYKLNLCKNE